MCHSDNDNPHMIESIRVIGVSAPTRGLAPHKCPICDGHGIVPGGYYNVTRDVQSWTSNNAAEPCRACKGSGIIYS